MTSNDKLKDERSNLGKLIQGLLAKGLQKQMSEPEYYVLDRETFEHAHLDKQRGYANEMQRLIKELRLNAILISKIDFEKVDVEYTPEEILNYHIGTFYDLVHQLKDKMRQLVRLVILEEASKNPRKDPSQKELKKYLKRQKEVLNKTGLQAELDKWNDENVGTIGNILNKRTIHHHYMARLELQKEFQDIKMSRIFLDQNSQMNVSEEGRKYMEHLGSKSFEALKSEAQKMQTTTIKKVVESVENVSNIIANNFDIPTNQSEIGIIFTNYSTFLGSFDIKNEASKDNLDEPEIRLVSSMLEGLNENKTLRDSIEAIYLVGSITRREIVPNVSDVNIYVITKIDIPMEMIKFPMSLKVIGKDALYTNAHKKDRFILWSDGLLIDGDKLKFNESEFPKPGAELCMLLNEDFRAKLEILRAEVEQTDEADLEEMRKLTVAVSKIMADYDFGVAMSNSPYYSASRQKRLEHTKKTVGDHRRTLSIEKVLYSNGIFTKDALIEAINNYLKETESSFKHLQEVLEKFKED